MKRADAVRYAAIARFSVAFLFPQIAVLGIVAENVCVARCSLVRAVLYGAMPPVSVADLFLAVLRRSTVTAAMGIGDA